MKQEEKHNASSDASRSIAIIPARSGSKGLPNKNILPLNGRPLLAWSVDAARQSGMFDTVHVSTDSKEYAKIARQYGADIPFLRSPETSTDTATSWQVVKEVLENYQELGKTFDSFMLLQPTSPLRTAEDICGAFQTMVQRKAKTVISVCRANHSPLWFNTLPEDGRMDRFLPTAAVLPRQLLPQYYQLNGSIYLFDTNHFLKKNTVVYDTDCYAYIMSPERSVDIDSPLDFLIAEALLSQGSDHQATVQIANVRKGGAEYRRNVFETKTVSNQACNRPICGCASINYYKDQTYVSQWEEVSVC